MIHFKHCYAYGGHFCGCGARQTGGYTGDKPGPDLPLPAAPFSLATRANTNGLWAEEES